MDSGFIAMPLKDLEIRTLKAQDRVYKRTDERGLYIEVRCPKVGIFNTIDPLQTLARPLRLKSYSTSGRTEAINRE